MSSPSAGREKGHLSLQVPWRQRWAGGTGWEVRWVLRCVLSNTCTLGAAPVGSQGLEVGVASVTQRMGVSENRGGLPRTALSTGWMTYLHAGSFL